MSLSHPGPMINNDILLAVATGRLVVIVSIEKQTLYLLRCESGCNLYECSENAFN